jgi:hypothetical protein
MNSLADFFRPFASLLASIALTTAACGSSPREVGSSAATAAPLPANTTRPTTKEACDACGGSWDFHGIRDVETCICPTKDAGKDCTDGQQCEGACIVSDNGFQIVESGTSKGYWVGQCSQYDVTYGCYRIIPTGTVAHGPHAAAEGFEDICVD